MDTFGKHMVLNYYLNRYWTLPLILNSNFLKINSENTIVYCSNIYILFINLESKSMHVIFQTVAIL